MKLNLRLLAAILAALPLSVSAAERLHIQSAQRPAGEDWLTTRARYEALLKNALSELEAAAAKAAQRMKRGAAVPAPPPPAPAAGAMKEVEVDGMAAAMKVTSNSALGSAKVYSDGFNWEQFRTIPSWDDYQTTGIPAWNSRANDDARYPGPADAYLKIFEKYRDFWTLTDPVAGHVDAQGQPLKRRPSWIYGNDGCFMRAAWMGRSLQLDGIIRPAKVFVFGNLKIKTNHDPSGAITWWYHVVGMIKHRDPVTKQENLYALDPAIDAGKPMLAADWVNTMTTPEERKAGKVLAVACSSGTYFPNSICELGSDTLLENHVEITEDQDQYFADEWNRLAQLGLSQPQIVQALNAVTTTLPQADALIPAKAPVPKP